MKKSLFFAFAVLCCEVSLAQPWIPVGNGPVKYVDALTSYKNSPYFIDEQDARKHGGENEEASNHFFETWNWYWRGHLDKDGYMAPPAKTLAEWQKSTAASGANATARTTATTSNWSFFGPENCSYGTPSGMGRINIVAFDPVDSNTFYAGSASGSTWKTTDGGLTWASLYNNLPSPGVADIKVNPINRNTVYMVSGDGDGGNTYSAGVYVSHDAGTTWDTAGLNWPDTYYRRQYSLLINPLDTNTMILGTSIGVFITHNGGHTWVNRYNSTDFRQLVYNPANPSIIYAVGEVYPRWQILRSTNGGVTWNIINSWTSAGRIALAVTPTEPNLVKAIVSQPYGNFKGIYTSNDSGASYTPTYIDTDCTRNLLGYSYGLPTADCGGQASYSLSIAINPANPAEMVVGGVNDYYSADSGKSWQIATQWMGVLPGVATVHADKHSLSYSPLTGALFETNDGGIFKNYGPLTRPWVNMSDGITVTQFYKIATDNAVSFCLGGCQDNGQKLLDSNATVDLDDTADGMQPLINYGDPAHIWYITEQYGVILMTRDGGAHFHNITNSLPQTGSWVAPYVLHPTDTATLILGYAQVYVSHDNGATWVPKSPVFDSSTSVNTLAISNSNPNYMYVTYDDYYAGGAVIKYTPDFGTTWSDIVPPTSSYISGLVIDPGNEKHIWITVSSYGVSKVWEYYTNTGTWTDFSAGLPDIPVQCMVIDTASQTKYAGSDVAIYYRDTTMNSWALYNTNLPVVEVEDLHINYTTNELWAATYGRGVWKSVKADNPRLGVSGLATAAGTFSIYPNPAATDLTIASQGTITVVSISNVLGQQVYARECNAEKITVNVAGLSAGIYYVKVNGGMVKKFVKD